MLLSRKYRYSITAFFIAFVFSIGPLCAQDEIREAPDSSIGPPPQVDVEEPYQPSGGSRHFWARESQSSGGGPDSIQHRQIPDSFVNTQLGDRDFWYANYIFKKKKKEEEEEKDISFFDHPAFQALLWIVIIGSFAAFLAVYLSNSNVSLFRRRDKRMNPGADIELDTDNIFEINYEKAIDKAIANANYRLAVRLMFLRLLKKLSDNNIIDYKTDRTNFDYLVQLSSTSYYSDFFRLTRNYEYVWYGHFDIDAERFPVVRRDFENFDHKIGKA